MFNFGLTRVDKGSYEGIDGECHRTNLVWCDVACGCSLLAHPNGLALHTYGCPAHGTPIPVVDQYDRLARGLSGYVAA